MQKCGHRDVVRQIRNQRGRLLEEVCPLKGEDVCVEDTQAMNLAVRVPSDGLGQALSQQRIDLDGGDGGATVEKCECQRTEAGPNLKNVILLVDSGGRDDSSYGVRVVDKVLTQRLTRPELKFLGQVPYLGTTE